MIRLNNLDKWAMIGPKKIPNFGNPKRRVVRLEFNAPYKTRVDISDGDGNGMFLATVDGHAVIEFQTPGEFAIIPDGDLWLYTVDGEDYSFAVPDAVALTKIAQRRTRNPEIEMMTYLANKNIERRMDAIRDELEQSWRRELEASKAAPPQPPAPLPNGDGAGEAKPSPTVGDAGDDTPDNNGSGNKPTKKG